MKHLIVFEGLPGCGKTSLSQSLTRHYKAESLPEVFWHDEVAQKTEEYFIVAEEKKVEAYHKSTSGIVIMDRSPISIVAHNYVRKIRGQANSYDEVLKWFRQIESKMEPYIAVYPRIENVAVCNRRKNRTEQTELNGKSALGDIIWTQSSYLEQFRQFYDDFFAAKPNVIIIGVDDKLLSAVKDEIIRELDKTI